MGRLLFLKRMEICANSYGKSCGNHYLEKDNCQRMIPTYITQRDSTCELIQTVAKKDVKHL